MRPDLPPGLGGWQVVDATPQETSDGRTDRQKKETGGQINRQVDRWTINMALRVVYRTLSLWSSLSRRHQGRSALSPV